ncbi:peptidoglycan-binding protein [Actinoplanes sp. NPDC023714]|uniref:peptidoglycan-binding protein n=1 Tax=Actinoplanes sp. NPDC023714 TaxID=3154322 RepID=UPI00340981F8
MSTLRWGSSGDEVAKLQETLQHLGYYTGRVDGQFGALTRGAVMAFQRAMGLVADGIVGPRTWEALAGEPATGDPGGQPGTTGGTPPNGNPAGSPAALSLHIGLNAVDPARYGGWNGALSGCENDARTMEAIAAAEGFTTRRLFTRDATTAGVQAAIADAARQLRAGGFFLITYAGHGGQVPNTGADPEDDQQDETWVLFDRQFLDDEIEQALAGFAPGVSIVMLSDSCHSGTVNRDMQDPVQRDVAELKRSFYTDLAVPRPGPGDDVTLSFPRPAVAVMELRERSARRQRGGSRPVPRFPGQQPQGTVAVLDRPDDTTFGVTTREMPFDINLMANDLQSEELADAKAETRAAGTAVRGNGLLISGCQDSQLSQETGGHGVFTTALDRVWDRGAFTGTYTTFHKAILARMGPTQTPNLQFFGADPQRLADRTPFDI